MKLFLFAVLSVFLAVIAGCTKGVKENVPPVITQPVEVRTTEVHYVPIDVGLTQLLALPPAWVTFGEAILALKAAEAAIITANARFACIGAIQGAETKDAPPCVRDLAPLQPESLLAPVQGKKPPAKAPAKPPAKP